MKLWKIFNNWRGRKDESSSIFPKKNRADLIREEGQKVGGEARLGRRGEWSVSLASSGTRRILARSLGARGTRGGCGGSS